MKTILNKWKLQSITFNNDLSNALQQQHHAARFIALVGRYLIPQEPDDSNTNMEFVFKRNLLIGNEMQNGLRLALNIENMDLTIIGKDKADKKLISLEGKTKNAVFNELAQNLADLGINVSGFKNELHYKIPEHQLYGDAVFSIININDFAENANYRHNAKIVLNEVTELIDNNGAIKIWPHHFDTGAFFVVDKNDKGEATKTIGIGFAIPDSMVNEPYYYLSFWSDNPIIGIKNISALDIGKWMMPDWSGAVLKHSEIIKVDTAEGQHKMVLDFFTSGINTIINLLNV